MNTAHLHNLTDAEFVRQFDNTDDPVLKEALRRIEVLRAEEVGEELRRELQESNLKVFELRNEVDDLKSDIADLNATIALQMDTK